MLGGMHGECVVFSSQDVVQHERAVYITAMRQRMENMEKEASELASRLNITYDWSMYSYSGVIRYIVRGSILE